MTALHDASATPVAAIKALVDGRGLAPSEARLRLSQSPVWQAEVDGARQLHDQLDAALSDPRPSRPLGISFVCLLLGWLGTGSLLFSVVFVQAHELPIPRWLGIFSFAYGVTAWFATFRLWRMDKTGLFWFRCWAAVVVSMAVAMIPVFSNQALGGVGGMLGVTAITAAFLWVVDRYVDKNLRARVR